MGEQIHPESTNGCPSVWCICKVCKKSYSTGPIWTGSHFTPLPPALVGFHTKEQHYDSFETRYKKAGIIVSDFPQQQVPNPAGGFSDLKQHQCHHTTIIQFHVSTMKCRGNRSSCLHALIWVEKAPVLSWHQCLSKWYIRVGAFIEMILIWHVPTDALWCYRLLTQSKYPLATRKIHHRWMNPCWKYGRLWWGYNPHLGQLALCLSQEACCSFHLEHPWSFIQFSGSSN